MNTYKFEDLTDCAKKELIEAQRSENENELEVEPFLESLIKKCFDIGFLVCRDEIQYTGFYAQGDGLSFTGTINVSDFLDKANHGLDIEEYKSLFKKANIEYIPIIRKYGNYVHEKSCCISELELEYDYLNDAYDAMERIRYELAVETYSDINDHFEEVISDKYCSDQIADLDCWYSEDGSEQFKDKPIVYDYEVLNKVYNFLKNSNKPHIVISGLMKKCSDIIAFQNFIEDLPTDDEYKLILRDCETKFNTLVRELYFSYFGSDVLKIANFRLPKCNCKDEHNHEIKCLWSGLQTTPREELNNLYITTPKFHTYDLEIILPEVKKISKEEMTCYDLSFESLDYFYVVFNTWSLSSYLKVQNLIHYLNGQYRIFNGEDDE